MRHFQIYLNNNEVIISAKIMKPLSDGQIYFYNSLSEDVIHIAPKEAMIIDITKKVIVEDFIYKIQEAISNYESVMDERVRNDIPIEDKNVLRKEAIKISGLYNELEFIKCF